MVIKMVPHGKISDVAIERMKNLADVEEILVSYGCNIFCNNVSEIRCTCPIHSDANNGTSFHYNKKTGTWRCYSCGEYGNVFRLVMKVEGVSFFKAVEKISAMTGVNIEYGTTRYDLALQSAKALKQQINTDATINDFNCFTTLDENVLLPHQNCVHQYILSRIKDYELIDKFEICYAKFGRLKGRILFPNRIPGGALVGISGRRVEGQTDGPKWYHWPPKFPRRNYVFGLSHQDIVDEIVAKKQVIVTEGHLDVVSLYAMGFKNAVAILGKTPSEQQIRVLSKYDIEVVVCLDGDAFKQGYSLKAGKKFMNYFKSISTVEMGEEEDPGNISNSSFVKAYENRSKIKGGQ
jgi:DNA primase